MNVARVVPLAVIVLLTLNGLSLGEDCEALKHADPDQLVSSLQESAPGENNAPCFTFAIYELGRRSYEPSVPILVRLLDFRRPPNEHEKRGSYIRMQGFYPAVEALEEIGKPALPLLLESIRKGSTSAVGRENAVSVWMEIYKYESPKGVGLLKEEAEHATDDMSKKNLRWAVSKALTWCNPPDRAECMRAAKTGRDD